MLPNIYMHLYFTTKNIMKGNSTILKSYLLFFINIPWPRVRGENHSILSKCNVMLVSNDKFNSFFRLFRRAFPKSIVRQLWWQVYIFSRRLYPKRLTIAFRVYIFISMCVPWELNPQPFALLTQCSTTEPHRNTSSNKFRRYQHSSTIRCFTKP